MVLFLFHLLAVNIRLIYWLQVLPRIHVRYVQTLPVPIPVHIVDGNFRTWSLGLLFRAGTHSFLFVHHPQGSGDDDKDGEGIESHVMLQKDLRNVSQSLRRCDS